MTLDRSNGSRDNGHDHDARCRRGWLGHDKDYRPIPCPVCRPWTAARSVVNDFAARAPSRRAQAAIDAQTARRTSDLEAPTGAGVPAPPPP
ncbi:hypothetical protein [Nocardia altamirensis]|uniref:hypothetical protein n=1 Tax=Nocardia altamirensis TaxID=472158 RepID=UPI00114CC457|nr:hypothetical protein [Nocardia altamirensis]